MDGRTPLHAAAEVAAIDVVEILLRHGADVHATDVVGMDAKFTFGGIFPRAPRNCRIFSQHGKTPAETVGVGLGPEVLAQLHEEGLLTEGDMVDDEELMRLMIEHPRAKAVREVRSRVRSLVGAFWRRNFRENFLLSLR